MLNCPTHASASGSRNNALNPGLHTGVHSFDATVDACHGAGRRRLVGLKLVAAGAVATTLTLGMQATAFAYPINLSYTWTVADGGNGGGGRVYGNFNFTGAKSLTFDVDIQDVCHGNGQGDGYGVGFRFVYHNTGGGYEKSVIKGVSQGNCGTGFTSASGSISRAHDLADAQPIALVTDHGEEWTIISPGGLGQVRDNAYT